MLKHERQAVKAARKLGFNVVDIEPRGSGHKIMHLDYKGKGFTISLPSSPLNHDEAAKLARRNLEKIKRSMK